MRSIIFGILVISIATATPTFSEQYMLVRVYTEDVRGLARLGLDIVKVKKGIAEVVAFPEQIPKLMEQGFSFDIIIDDMEKYYSERMSGRTNFGDFYTYSEANAIVDSLYTAHSEIMTQRIEIGQGHEGNKIWAVKVSDNPNTDENEPEVLYDACIHAREPITVNVLVETIRYLVDKYGSDPEVTSIVNNCELWFILVLNPDGYLYNETIAPGGGGMWRKNRRSDPGPVDLNRNFPYNWGYDDVGSSPDPGSEVYRGPSPASEPETQAYINFCKEHEFVVNLSYHSYAGCLIYPWGYDGSHVPEPDYSTYVAMAETLTSENNYPYGTVIETIWYVANGGTFDWMYGDTIAKPKIFSLSPEVAGYGFWDEASIPRNLEECIPMNLKLARLAQNMWTPKYGVMYLKHKIDDVAGGNGDGIVNPGESIEMPLWVKNWSQTIVYGVSGILSSTDTFITQLSDSIKNFGNIASNDSSYTGSDGYNFTVAQNCPDRYKINFNLTIKDSQDSTWVSNFNVIVAAPDINFKSYTVNDQPPGGNGNGGIEPGETGDLVITLKNTGTAKATGVNATIITSDPYVTVNVGAGNCIDIEPDSTANLSPLNVTISSVCPAPHYAEMLLNITATGYSTVDTFTLFILTPGFCDSLEPALPGWTHYSITSGYSDEWHIETYRSHSPTHSWKCGGAGSASYSNRDDAGLESPPILVVPGYYLQFWHWIDAETETQTSAWDGGIVEISRDEGLSWQQITPTNGYPYTIIGNPQSPFPGGTPCYSGTQDWTLTQFDLTGYTGVVNFRWRFGSDRSVTKEGWYIDDIYVGPPTGVEVSERMPTSFGLSQNRPNPFTKSSVISYQLPVKCHVSLKIYDCAGRLVKTLINEDKKPGYYSVKWDGYDSFSSRVSSGVYFYKLESNKFNKTMKLIIL
ncbi:MAG: M14 family zinc carboxypeptidase [bacterium]|nr:M14 family zinc carboxypeptidase [bacterium]